ncbi:MAG: M42 family peptidase [Clostridia bacterium]|nr:M42 family peptidase [Clostridia bacterium]
MDIKQLERLCLAFGVSGEEDEVREALKKEITADAVYTDKAGNLIAVKKSKNEHAPTLLLDAHMDSVGLCVKEVGERGFLRVASVGGMDAKILPNTLVEIGKEHIPGVVASKPPHLMDKKDAENVVSLSMLWVDTGDNAESIRVGDRIRYAPRFAEMLSAVSGTYLDNRVGCGLILETFKRLQDVELPFNLTAVFSTGEEMGLKGAKYGAVQGDMAIVLDVTFGKTPDETSDEALDCTKGVAIGVGPNMHKAISKGLLDRAEKNGIMYQTEVLEGCSGTNAWMYQVQNLGIPCGLLSVPIRYMHTPVETMFINDFESTADLLFAYITNLSADEIRAVSEVEVC